MTIICKENFLAEGTYQECYIHPSNKNLCIKIDKAPDQITRLSNEINYIKRISKKKIKDTDYIFFSRYKGQIETNLGKGYVYELIRDEQTQEVSKTLYYYLWLMEDNPIDNNKLDTAYSLLIDLMIKYKIVANDIRLKNICCKILSDNTIQLIHIDGLGHRDFLPLVDWFSFFTKKKVKRRLIRFDLQNLDIQRNLIKAKYENMSVDELQHKTISV